MLNNNLLLISNDFLRTLWNILQNTYKVQKFDVFKYLNGSTEYNIAHERKNTDNFIA